MGIREAYRTYLGRDASDDEVANWESGAYGYGDNPAAWVDAIRNSGEAQAYAARSQGGGGGSNEAQGGGGGGSAAQGGGGDGGGGAEEPTGGQPGTGGNAPPSVPGPSAPADEAQDPALRAQIAAAYKTHLLRDASDAEITAWLSGQNGWGKGAAGISRIVQGIATSGEAKAAQSRYATGANAANPGQAGRTDYQNTDWWARQGVSSDQIFDANGQLKPGWENFSGGIRRAPGAANMGNLLGFNQQNYSAATSASPTMNSVKYGFAQIANRYPPTPSGLKQLMEDPEFKNRFPKAKLVGHDSIDFGGALSDGATGEAVGVVDVGQMFDKGANTGNGWWWGPAGSGDTTTTPAAPKSSAAAASATARGFTASGGGSSLFNPAATAGPMAMGAYNQNEANRAGAFDRNVGNAASAYNTNAENAYRQYTTNTAGQNMANQEAEARRSGAYNTNLGAYENQQQYGLRSQAQAYDQQYRNWVEQYNQGRNNATDTYNRMYGLI